MNKCLFSLLVEKLIQESQYLCSAVHYEDVGRRGKCFDTSCEDHMKATNEREASYANRSADKINNIINVGATPGYYIFKVQPLI